MNFPKNLCESPPGVNFINILRTNFSYEQYFCSFFYLHVTRKKAAEDFRTKNTRVSIDEIDRRSSKNLIEKRQLKFFLLIDDLKKLHFLFCLPKLSYQCSF